MCTALLLDLFLIFCYKCKNDLWILHEALSKQCHQQEAAVMSIAAFAEAAKNKEAGACALHSI